MATVYLARNVETGTSVAVKILRRDLCSDPKIRTRFFNESHAVQRIDHPAVVKTLEVGETDEGHICLVMELVQGKSLRRLLESRAIRLEDGLSIIGAVAEGLATAHAENVIHRDLKPENILVPMAADSATAAKLVDFGIARIIDAPRITTTQHIMGTPHYIAPEQARGDRVDQRADIYSLGIVMFEIISGRLPFDGDNPDALLRQHIGAPPPRLSARVELPDSIRDLVMSCLSKSPFDRPQNMREFLQRLESR